MSYNHRKSFTQIALLMLVVSLLNSAPLAQTTGFNYQGRLTVFRPSQATWYSNRTTAGVLIAGFGLPGDTPVPSAFVP
jgi:hypothetical protein